MQRCFCQASHTGAFRIAQLELRFRQTSVWPVVESSASSADMPCALPRAQLKNLQRNSGAQLVYGGRPNPHPEEELDTLRGLHARVCAY
ncbi:uncharacterized protein L969DRAFT_56351 [Mixia osmundae IAM 14324]|uniref:Uncharacterized protein n=1 Tax=Mixia osmundae (strain CBS 9802 / IAM 14324 / JCM 22182 / KY 12970) TaxID=764103 RepID=G7DV72_MIXOS|nr:uncharacterized protein L969DRAFT_56351 [Mixia osmundae IAM 14324]KEI42094.1 hypothetical protein L969DRAFT_56351 [Mixia osmundae IAM 14324]GAA94482.1 hypothetical protein E5Q_01134 [Mixia osmundae IAM 14324]